MLFLSPRIQYSKGTCQDCYKLKLQTCNIGIRVSFYGIDVFFTTIRSNIMLK
jgi:hypothetical protein